MGPENKHYISWAKLLRRIFDIDIKTCPVCGAKMKILKALLKRDAIEKILTHLKLPNQPPTISPARPPPQLDYLLFLNFNFSVLYTTTYNFHVAFLVAMLNFAKEAFGPGLLGFVFTPEYTFEIYVSNP